MILGVSIPRGLTIGILLLFLIAGAANWIFATAAPAGVCVVPIYDNAIDDLAFLYAEVRSSSCLLRLADDGEVRKGFVVVRNGSRRPIRVKQGRVGAVVTFWSGDKLIAPGSEASFEIRWCGNVPTNEAGRSTCDLHTDVSNKRIITVGVTWPDRPEAAARQTRQ